VVYDYSFTDLAARRKTGEWWQRKPARIYLPKIWLTANAGGPSGRPAKP
jgi:hypothetical protein